MSDMVEKLRERFLFLLEYYYPAVRTADGERFASDHVSHVLANDPTLRELFRAVLAQGDTVD
jgi:hypothetical protein